MECSQSGQILFQNIVVQLSSYENALAIEGEGWEKIRERRTKDFFYHKLKIAEYREPEYSPYVASQVLKID